MSSQVDALVKCIKGERTALGLPNHIVGMTTESGEVILQTPPQGHSYPPVNNIWDSQRQNLPEGDSADMDGFEGNERAMPFCITLMLNVCSAWLSCFLLKKELVGGDFVEDMSL